MDQGKRNVLGVQVSAVDYDSAVDKVMSAAREGRSLAVTALAVHGVMTGVQDKAHGARLNAFDLVTPDGQPVRWALNVLHGARLADRVYGPELTLRVIKASADEGLPVYMYGSTQETLDKLAEKLPQRFPGLKIAGMEPSKFRSAQPGEPEQIAARIKESGARVVMVGLGCPRQEIFVYGMRHLIDAPMLAVGAAFDYHAGGLKNPPAWMQKYALEWLWRLGLEPKRLWRRYILLNPNYLARLTAQKVRLWRAAPPSPATEPLKTFAV
ncbi:WecB/TagA/CpsF family glycosyltransferase [Dactylosporangium fulvum]|uniref:WecB/TagA/CpsF family glycosyltransferase n=1 Tax=Dactylosporangium fulvum TaxID=53359 RepID=A0ABY5WEB6_9ACTN|nr:WecB/TagA/CpsF family glycosyltransferase [Dactylosporangium fulvum]UWP87771.1 WecB/TagA/CpsF family glycosyltransferase [Dactylosporangium fulvum]